MKHFDEQKLIEHYYGGEHHRPEVEEHLAACPACQASYLSLAKMLDAVSELSTPERGEGYGRDVYARLLPRLEAPEAKRDWRSWFRIPRLAAAGAMVALLLVAFMAGRFWPRQAAVAPGPNTAQIRERILLVAVGDHLDRSQMVLLELANAPETSGKNRTVDISGEQQWARELVPANRLYRQTAMQNGEAGVAAVLDELERLLLDVANSPAQIPERDWEGFRRRIEEKGILFKVRVIGSEVRRREQQQAPPAAGQKL